MNQNQKGPYDDFDDEDWDDVDDWSEEALADDEGLEYDNEPSFDEDDEDLSDLDDLDELDLELEDEEYWEDLEDEP